MNYMDMGMICNNRSLRAAVMHQPNRICASYPGWTSSPEEGYMDCQMVANDNRCNDNIWGNHDNGNMAPADQACCQCNGGDWQDDPMSPGAVLFLLTKL